MLSGFGILALKLPLLVKIQGAADHRKRVAGISTSSDINDLGSKAQRGSQCAKVDGFCLCALARPSEGQVFNRSQGFLHWVKHNGAFAGGKLVQQARFEDFSIGEHSLPLDHIQLELLGLGALNLNIHDVEWNLKRPPCASLNATHFAERRRGTERTEEF